jgi:cell division protein FtsL
MTTGIKKLMNWKWMLVILVAGSLITSCKNKKKALEVSDTAQVKEEIIKEIEATENEVKTPVAKPNLSGAEQLTKYMTAIAKSTSLTEANNNIKEATSLFSSQEAVVLIEIFSDGDVVDYDEPTTIGKYLQYLKDQKKSPAKVQDVVYDGQGKIKELVLRRAY